MKADPHIRSGCTEEFAELCALSTTGALSAEDRAFLEKHLTGCGRCRELLADYEAVAHLGMARIAAEENVLVPSTSPPFPEWNHEQAKRELLEKLNTKKPTTADSEPAPAPETPQVFPRRRALVRALSIATVLILGLAAGYKFGVYRAARPSVTTPAQVASTSIERQLRDIESQRDALNAALAANAKTIEDLNRRAKEWEGQRSALQADKTALEAKAQQASVTSQEQTQALSGERDGLLRRLADAEQSLKSVKQALDSVQQERRQVQLRTVSLETTIDDLSTRLRERDETVKRDEEFLASDRDVRELMGARQLYIADVFDVDQSGSKRQPYGRVFYTKGKSLVFYAFDLDQLPAYRDAKAPASKTFQVWGSAGQDNAKPIGLGIFYLDSEANRRWVFKSDDPNVLAQVNALFVTVESKEGSKKPSGKPFLYAYLRTAPINHP
ncbi:MAG TPA: zf-HC2 domain-containing protein [Candidatus Acidoferrum sp.]|nr:zf-HC2 domain-containing protein [Candidatus Acidoferrum sp.]